jgi:hypothetical protein
MAQIVLDRDLTRAPGAQNVPLKELPCPQIGCSSGRHVVGYCVLVFGVRMTAGTGVAHAKSRAAVRRLVDQVRRTAGGLS